MADLLTRRAWMGVSVSGVALAGIQRAAGDQTQPRADTVVEAERLVPVVDTVDVAVCGGGPAGIAAAMAAARTGASVRLLEAHGCLGGIWTSGMLAYVIEADKPGINAELIRRLDALDARRATGSNYIYDVETMKFVLEELCREDKIKVQYHTRIVAVEQDDNHRVRGVITESKSGRQAWRAAAVIDTTGDGDAGALAGCEWEFGRGPDCPCQPMSLMGVITAGPEALGKFDTAADLKNRERFRAEIRRAGIDPTYGLPTLWYLGGHVAAVMLNHEYGVRPFDAAAVTEATMNARRELFQITRALRKLGGIWEGCSLVTTAEQIGVRDGRRIKGRYFVTVDDLLQGARHEDAVCRSAFHVDIHAATLKENENRPYSTGGVRVKPYDIPLRALIAKDVDGLLIAGRCISGDFVAHASYRVTGNAVALGEAAGITAALAARQKLLPHDVPWPQIAAELRKLRS
jgi:hypothetical protein